MKPKSPIRYTGPDIRRLRKEKKISIKKLSELTGVSRTIISNYESEKLLKSGKKRDIRRDTMYKLLDVLLP